LGKARFLNQKLGKRVSRKFDLLKSELRTPRNAASRSGIKIPKKSTKPDLP
jgi:hypothetical protein